jgi:hypothetical protein
VALLAGILAAYSFDRIFDTSASSTPAWVNRVLLAVGTAGALTVAEHRTAVALTAAILGLSTLTPELLAVDNTGPLVVDVILTLPGILISTRLV